MMFSVIIPAHDSKAYIGRLLHSIKMQTFTNYEVMVVCDDCHDTTAKVAIRYADKVICTKYGSDGLARDEGLSVAEGDWILFADDDDWFVHEFCFQQIADAIKGDWTDKYKDIDILAFGYLCKGQGYIAPSEKTIFNPGDAHVWSNAWKRSAIAGAKFGDAIFCSDTYFVRDVKFRTRRYALLNMPIYYYYFNRPGSQTDRMIRGEIRVSPIAR